MQTDREIAQQLTDRLVHSLGASRVVWFGSRATGSARADSDWDLLVVADLAGSAAMRAYRAEQATADVAVPKDFVVVTPAEYARLRGWRSSVVHAAEARGAVLYAESR